MRTPISIFLITYNEADRIGPTIRAVRSLSDDIVVVDSGSTDQTQQIARSMGARVIHHDWEGYGPQKMFAEAECKYDWLFNIDADEVVTPILNSEISDIFNTKDTVKPCAYTVRICDVAPGDNAPRPLAYAHKYVRLYHRRAGQFASSTVHDTVRINRGFNVRKLTGRIYHYSIVDISTQIAKFNRYTDALVDDMRVRNLTKPGWRVFTEFPSSFLKAYIMRRYFVRGIHGYTDAMNYAFFRYLRMAKLVEARRKRAR